MNRVQFEAAVLHVVRKYALLDERVFDADIVAGQSGENPFKVIILTGDIGHIAVSNIASNLTKEFGHEAVDYEIDSGSRWVIYKVQHLYHESNTSFN